VSSIERVAVLGAGRMGRALAIRMASAGHHVVLGSRQPASAQAAVASLGLDRAARHIEFATYDQAVTSADIVFLAVPYEKQLDVLGPVREALIGRMLVTAVVALDPAAPDRVTFPLGRSAAMEAQAFLGQGIPVVAAFQTLMYRLLQEVNTPTEAEVWVASDDQAARRRIVELAESTGLAARDIGPLVNSLACEALGSVTMRVGQSEHAKHVGVRLTGVWDESPPAAQPDGPG
jgi:8-hydroxy-5-deazaflavin:NADPH oxidoreductase